MENNERLNEINNSEVEKLLIGKMQDIFGENKTRYFRTSLQNRNKFGNEIFYKSTEKIIERTYLECDLIWMMM